MYKFSIVKDFSFNFGGKVLPKGALFTYGTTKRGEKVCIFTDDIGMICKNYRFPLVFLYKDGHEVRRTLETAYSDIATQFKIQADSLPESYRVKARYAVTNKELARQAMLPKEKRVPMPMQRCHQTPRTKVEDAINGNEQRYVTDGVQVGSRRFNDIGYHAQRLGMRYEWYGNSRATVTAAEDAAFREFFNNGGFTAAE